MCLSVRPSVSRMSVRPVLFPDENFNGFSQNLVCALILWRSVWIANGQISLDFDRVIRPNGGVL